MDNKEILKMFKAQQEQINDLARRLDNYLNGRIDDTNEVVEETQIGLTEAYEYTDGAYTELTDLQLAVTDLYETILGGDE